MTDLTDTEARSRILTEFGTSFFVEAAAGTGKTSVLVGRIVGLVRTGGGTLDRIVAVTFTEKAAGEMKLRLRSEIEKARALAAPEERNRLDHALEQLELARIGTIHAFCGDLLHERPVEAGIDPLFEVASEDEAEALADEAFEGWFQTHARRSTGGRSANSQTPIGQTVPARTTAQCYAGSPRSTAIFQSPGAVMPSTGTARSTHLWTSWPRSGGWRPRVRGPPIT